MTTLPRAFYDRDTLVVARDIPLQSDAAVSSMTVDLPAGSAGVHELRFVLDPLEGERNVVNNVRTRVVNVPAGRRNVLYVEGEPRWEYKFLRRAVSVEFRVRDSQDHLVGDILFDTVDISEGGAFLRSQYLFEVGEVLDVSFTLPGQGGLLYAQARVAWVTRQSDAKGEAGMGVEFITIDDAARRAITAFVRVNRIG